MSRPTGVRGRRTPATRPFGSGPAGRWTTRRAAGILVLATLFVTGCTLRLASEYDEEIDRTATSLQREMDAHLTGLGSAVLDSLAAFDQHEAFYRDYEVRLRSLELRARAHRKNELTVRQLETIAASLAELREQHRDAHTLSPAYVEAARELFNTAWAAVIAWEIAKKRDGR